MLAMKRRACEGTSAAGETKQANPHYDVFISYATEDLSHAEEARDALQQVGLNVYLDVPQHRPPSSLLGLLRERLRSLTMHSRRDTPSGVNSLSDLLTPNQVAAKLNELLDSSDSVLVLWSQSHRGSYWSREELSYFERQYPTRPIFCLPLDATNLSWPSPQWCPITDIHDINHETIATGSSLDTRSRAIPSEDSFAKWTLLRPQRWVDQVWRLRSGTTIPELLRMRADPAFATRPGAQQVWQTAQRVLSRGLLATLVLSTLVLSIPAVLDLLRFEKHVMAARNCLFIFASVWALSPVAGMQASIASLAPAALAGIVFGLGTQELLAFLTSYTHAEPAAGCALGVFFGFIGAYEWTFRARPGGSAPVFRASAKLAVAGMTVGIMVSLLMVIGIAAALARDTGNLRGFRAAPILLALAILSGAALWQEVSRGGRVREMLYRGVKPAGALLGAFLLLGVLVWLIEPKIDHDTIVSGLVAGGFLGLCAGNVYVSPGIILGVSVPSEARALGSIVAVSATLFCLYPILATVDPCNNLLPQLWAAYATYIPSLMLAFFLARALLARAAQRGGT